MKAIQWTVGLILAWQASFVSGAVLTKEGAKPVQPVVTSPTGVTRVPAYMDGCEVELRKRLQGTGVSVERAGGTVKLTLPGNITFRANSADIEPRFYEVLNGIGLILQKYAKTSVEISGYMDSLGRDQQALTLSEKRAWAVAQDLFGRGLARERTHVAGYGKSHPVASNDTEAGRTQNRRVEILLVPD